MYSFIFRYYHQRLLFDCGKCVCQGVGGRQKLGEEAERYFPYKCFKRTVTTQVLQLVTIQELKSDTLLAL